MAGADTELVTPEAAHEVGAAHAADDGVGRPGQDVVARQVAEHVVHRLEVVDVHDGDGHELLLTTGVAQRRGGGGPPRLAVEDTGLGVVASLVLQRLVE